MPLGRADRSPDRGRRGIVLVVVLFFALLLAGTVATFAKIALIDHMVIRNRDARSRAEALARGGVRLATALLLDDKLHETDGQAKVDNREELWARVSGTPIEFEDGSSLRVEIEDVGARLNLNAVMVFDDAGNADTKTVELLTRLFDKVIGELPGRREEQPYDPAELAVNLIDYVDEDDVSLEGGPEDDVYQKRIPPARPANQPLLSVDELRRVEGFDQPIVDALRPYVTVYPFVGGGGINPNTAPPHVLSLLFFDDEVELRLADEDVVRSILRTRPDGGVCAEGQSETGDPGANSGNQGNQGNPSAERCTPIQDIVTNAIFPEPQYSSDVFVITAHGAVGDVQRRIEAVLDRKKGASPVWLSWRVL